MFFYFSNFIRFLLGDIFIEYYYLQKIEICVVIFTKLFYNFKQNFSCFILFSVLYEEPL